MTERCLISMLPPHTQMISCLNGLNNSTWLPVKTRGWILGRAWQTWTVTESPAWWDHELPLLSMCVQVEWHLLWGSRWKSCLWGRVNYQITFGKPPQCAVSVVLAGYTKQCQRYSSSWCQKGMKVGERLLGASSADKPANCADCQSEEWKERRKRGSFASSLIHLFHRKAHKVTHRPSIHS